jgi:hypothetical protein
LDNKASKKEIAELVKEQFGTKKGNKGIFLRDINNNVERFTNKLMACKVLRRCRKEEAIEGFIIVTAQCVKGVMFIWASYLLN